VSVLNIPGLIRGGQVEKYGDGDSITCTVASGQAATGGRLVSAAAGDRVVQTSAAADVNVFGVAMHDQSAGGKVTVALEGIWMLTASGSISAGTLVVAAASGQVSAAGATPDARTIVGRAIADATNGNLVPVKLLR